ncbi:MAG: ABC transporter permease [Anaerolineales bacterium]|jgi:ABC-type antimicrobial peptide transport system permease subunit
MIWKNILRRKGRTILTVLGISVGVAAIIGLGALAKGFEAGYSSMLSGSQADLVVSQPEALDISLSAIDEEVGGDLAALSEVKSVSGMLEGFVQAEGSPFFFVFGYPLDSFLLDRFQIQAGDGFGDRSGRSSSRAIWIGSAAAESFNKDVGDSIRLGDSLYKVEGIYQTGDPLEDSGSVIALEEAQVLLGKPRQVSLFYILLKDPSLDTRLMDRVERRWPDLAISTTSDFLDNQITADVMQGYVWAIAGLAILIGGVGMTNAQLMAVYERTREIGVLRAVGWSRWRVLRMILVESIFVGLLGGVIGIGLGWLALFAFSDIFQMFGANTTSIGPDLLSQAVIVVLTLGLVGGIYPAWRASQLEPVEALRYEGGSSGSGVKRLPFGGMPVQSLWQRTTRTLLTLFAIALTVGSILTLESIVNGAGSELGNMISGSDAEIAIRQADIADTSLSAIDERVVDRIAALPEVRSVSGMVMNAVMLPETGGFMLLLGYAPNEFAIQRFDLIEGQRLNSNHQIMIGATIAEATNKDVGDTMEISGQRFKIVGIFETGVGWEDMSGVISLRDAQAFAGRPRKVTMLMVDVREPRQAPSLVEEINVRFPEVHAAASGEFVEQMPDMQNADGMLNGISILAIAVGGVGVLNTMLMSILERTREIGVLRAIGWRRRTILSLILREALLLGLIGGAASILIALLLATAIQLVPMFGEAIQPEWTLGVFLRAILIAVLLGLFGGLLPAYRATRLQPVEALRYE